jgi:hypothetical protein
MSSRAVRVLSVGIFLGAAACGGGGSPTSAAVPHPLVRQFSPSLSPIDFSTGQANPTFTDGFLTVSTDPAYPGEIVVFFQQDTQIDASTVFIGGNPALGIDYSAFQVLQFIPGTGNVPLSYSQVIVEGDKIRFIPATLPLPNGQYSIGVFANLKSTEGDAVDKAPVFHSFTVGPADTIAPVVVVTTPVNTAQGIGAGVPPPPPPSGAPSSSIADVRTAIFGPTSPDIIIRFSESIAASTVNTSTITAVNASAFVPGGGAPPAIAPAPGFPKLRSQFDHSSLPSNGFEVIWRADPAGGGLPFGSQVQVTVVGSDGGTHSSPIRDRSDNALAVTYQFQFQTIAPPLLPEGSEPEYTVYYSTVDRIGAIDSINQNEIGRQFLGIQTYPLLPNVKLQYSDTVATKATLGSRFDPNEISVDCRTNAATNHTYIYVQSAASSQIVIVNTRTMLPVALINTPTPGGVSNQTGGGSAANVLLVTNASANTYTVFNIGGIAPGQAFLNNPITIQQVSTTGNTPKAISISASSTGAGNRSSNNAGPSIPLIFYCDFTDGVVNTATLGRTTPIKQFALGTGASPNDVSLTTCPPATGLLYAAISEGGAVGEGKIAYYASGPGCRTGITAAGLPDAIIGDLSGFDAPAGLDELRSATFAPIFFAVAESGSTANRVVTLGNSGQFPTIVGTWDTGANPVTVCHLPPWLPTTPANGFICAPPGSPGCPLIPTATYSGTTQFPFAWDGPPFGALAPCRWLYVCARGSGRIDVMDLVSGAHPTTPDRTPIPAPPADHISIPGVKGAFTTNSQ